MPIVASSSFSGASGMGLMLPRSCDHLIARDDGSRPKAEVLPKQGQIDRTVANLEIMDQRHRLSVVLPARAARPAHRRPCIYPPAAECSASEAAGIYRKGMIVRACPPWLIDDQPG